MSATTELRIHGSAVRLLQGDITAQDTDAVVNAANPDLAPGGGVAGAIHRAGGPAITEACAHLRRERGPLPTGEAVITPGGALAAPWVIHTVGPVWYGGTGGEPGLLACSYRACLAIVREQGLRTVAFPSLSTGAYGYPLDKAASVALGTVVADLRKHKDTPIEVRFVLFSARDLAAYAAALGDLAEG